MYILINTEKYTSITEHMFRYIKRRTKKAIKITDLDFTYLFVLREKKIN